MNKGKQKIDYTISKCLKCGSTEFLTVYNMRTGLADNKNLVLDGDIVGWKCADCGEMIDKFFGKVPKEEEIEWLTDEEDQNPEMEKDLLEDQDLEQADS